MASLFYGVPLVQADQAQKHVTVNEGTELALALAAGAVVSATDAAPSSPAEGAVYLVRSGGAFTTGEGDALAEGDLAIRLGGAWFGGLAPAGHRVLVLDDGCHMIHAGGGTWRRGSVIGGATGAPLGLEVRDVVLDLSGSSVTASGLIPSRAIVLGVTSWVVETVTGASAYEVGDGGSSSRYGSGLGLAAGSSNVGVVGPFATYSATDVTVTATGADFTGGKLGLAAAILLPGAPL